MITEREALDRIAALCNKAEASRSNYGTTLFGLTKDVRAVLAEVSPEPGLPDDLAEITMTQQPHGTRRFTAKVIRVAPGQHPLGDDVSPEPGGVLDRDQARDVLDRFRRGEQGVEVTLDHLAQFVRPAAIDRDALDALLFAFAAAVQKRRSEGEGFDIRPWLDRFVALVRPVTGVWVSPEEAALAATALRLYDVRDATVNTLAARFEAAS